MKGTINLIKKLTSIVGPSGYEDEIREVIKKEVKKLKIKHIEETPLGALIVKVGSGKKKIMLAGHMDEIGILSTHIDKKGFIRFANIGGVSKYGLIGSRIKFVNGVSGLISTEPIKKPEQFSFEKLYIDIGAKNKTAAAKLVPVGTFGVFDKECVVLGNRIISKAMDDRIGCVVMLNVLKKVYNKKLPYQVYFVFTTQEEVGLRGAKTSAFKIDPDFGIALDVTGTGDTPEGYKMAVNLGDGVAIKVKDRSLITHPKLKDVCVKLAEEKNIKYQLEILEWGGTDAGAIHLTRAGIPSTVFSIPTRYIHSQSEMIDMDDVKATEALLEKIITTKDLGNLKF
ncbi:M42 family metallopeptidase [Candidatus Dependentiae bacterium]|nr:M42 family metallopeptidase [Candidatus Dependentiae bacterium]